VALEPLRLVGPRESREVEGDAGDEAVDVGSDADPGVLHQMMMPERQSTV
jgi:hypothetical protein